MSALAWLSIVIGLTFWLLVLGTTHVRSMGALLSQPEVRATLIPATLLIAFGLVDTIVRLVR